MASRVGHDSLRVLSACHLNAWQAIPVASLNRLKKPGSVLERDAVLVCSCKTIRGVLGRLVALPRPLLSSLP